jgi:hypothetical protein
MLDSTWVIGLTMSDWDLIPPAVAVNHRMAALTGEMAMWLRRGFSRRGRLLHGWYDARNSLERPSGDGGHQKQTRGSGVVALTFGGGASSVQGTERAGLAQIGVAQRPQARRGVTVVRNSIEKQCHDQKRRLGFHLMWNEIRGSTTAFYRAFRSRITSTSWILFLSMIRFLFGEDFILGRDFPHPPLVWTLLGATWMMESGWAALD